jgi:hypothetical protein
MGDRLEGPGVTAATAMAAVESVWGGAEVIDSRYRDFRFTTGDVAADNASSGAFVTGPGLVVFSGGMTDAVFAPPATRSACTSRPSARCSCAAGRPERCSPIPARTPNLTLRQAGRASPSDGPAETIHRVADLPPPHERRAP